MIIRAIVGSLQLVTVKGFVQSRGELAQSRVIDACRFSFSIRSGTIRLIVYVVELPNGARIPAVCCGRKLPYLTSELKQEVLTYEKAE